MNTQGENTAEELFEEFLNGGEAAKNPGVLLARCRPEERQRLIRALEAVDGVLKYHQNAPMPTAGGASRLRARLVAAKRREEILSESERQSVPFAQVRLADAERRIQEMRTRLRLDPLSTMAEALNIVGPSIRRGSDGGAATVMRRSSAEVRSKPSYDDSWRRAQELRLQEEAVRVLTLARYAAPPVDLRAVARALSLLVAEENLDSSAESGTEGCIVMDGEAGGILINTAIRLEQRRRFTFGHEIGHFVLHKAVGMFRDTEAELSDYASVKELEANLFSSALLMPKSDLIRYAKPSVRPAFSQAHLVSEAFKVSLQAALIRIVRESDYACAFVASRAGRIQFACTSPHLDVFVPRGEALQPGTIAAELYRTEGGGRASKSAIVSARLWFGERSSGYLQETSLRLNSEEYIYTILTASE